MIISKSENKILLNCSHNFHYNCFVMNIEYDNNLTYNSCPICRNSFNMPYPITKDMKKKMDDKCPICLNKLGYKFNIHKTECGHSFHKNCFNIWEKQNSTCPMCRRTV
jgi:hypothetical protein